VFDDMHELLIGSDRLEPIAIACTVGADLRVRPGLDVQATAGADTQVCPYTDLQIALDLLH